MAEICSGDQRRRKPTLTAAASAGDVNSLRVFGRFERRSAARVARQARYLLRPTLRLTSREIVDGARLR